jgi:hypothetical protein
MKSYPSIQKDIQYGIPVYVFDKLDGSNIRAEWDKKKGFWKFGSRNVLIDKSHKFLGESIDLIKEQESAMMKILTEQRWEKGIVFFEFFGKNSFAGFHSPEDVKQVSLIDVMPFKQGILSPDEFVELFSETIPTAKFLFRGNINQDVEKEIRERKMDGITFEGVICKVKKNKKIDSPTMFKIKTYDWLTKLKEHCKDDENLYKTLE